MIPKVLNTLFLLGLFPWLPIFGVSGMLFDAPGSESNPVVTGMFWSIASYPVLCAVGFFASKGFKRLEPEETWRAFFSFLPLLSPVAFAFFSVALTHYCGGMLACGY